MSARRLVSGRILFLIAAVALAVAGAVVANAAQGRFRDAVPAALAACGQVDTIGEDLTADRAAAVEAQLELPAAAAHEEFYRQTRDRAPSLDLSALRPECEVLLVPPTHLDETGMKALIDVIPDGLDVTRVHVALPTAGRTTVTHFTVPTGVTTAEAVDNWRAEVEFSIAENLENALDEEFRRSTMADLEPADAAEFEANLDQYVADTSVLLDQLRSGNYVVYGIRVAARPDTVAADLAELASVVDEAVLGAVIIRRGGNPIGFRSPVDPSGDRRLEELRAEGRLPSQLSEAGS
ncbi:MAG: hypothetical protein KJ698_04415 [Actinobacteria bacterium]|nr:hypothetical protein [Actinomycetota bacterium]